MNEIQLLKKYIDDAPGNRLKLVKHLGLSSITAPSKWVERERLPWPRKEKIITYLERYFNGTHRAG